MCLLTGLKKLKKKLFCKNWTEDWWKSRQCPQKTLKDLQKALRTTAQNHFKKLKKSQVAWKENIKKCRVIQDFCTVMYT